MYTDRCLSLSPPRAGGRWLGPTGVTRGNGSGPCLFRSGRHKGLSLSPPSARGGTKAWVYHPLCVCRGRLFLEAAQGLGFITASVPRFKCFHSPAWVRDFSGWGARFLGRDARFLGRDRGPVQPTFQSNWNASRTGMSVGLECQFNWHSSPTGIPVQLTIQSN